MNKKYYIIKLESYSGDNSSLCCNSDGCDYMYCVAIMTENNAELIDMGYPSVDELLVSWKNVSFQNLGKIS